MSLKTPLLVAVALVLVTWFYLFYSIFDDNKVEMTIKDASVTNYQKNTISQATLSQEFLRRRVSQSSHREGPSLSEIERNMTQYITVLHSRLQALAGPKADAEEIWEAFLEVTRDTMIKWDIENKNRYFDTRSDDSIYVSLGTYRDPYCPMTLKSLYAQAKYPQKINVGLLQQNCFDKVCRTGVLKDGVVEDMGADLNCYEEFCKSNEGIASNACNTGQIRLYNINESESLGPYMARYLGAKFYQGENYYLQIDSHSEFVSNWDEKLIKMIHDAPAENPVISTYPPDSTMNWKDSVGMRICDAEFASSQIEWHIIRLAPSRIFESKPLDIPPYAPFVAAGFFFSNAKFLREVPFDPLLPWIFMGEEISMSARLWTSGYDIFAPTTNVLNHYYVRRHYPKFWESVNRAFKHPVHNEIVELVIRRVKSMLAYPEMQGDLVQPPSLLYRLDAWAMGTKRSFKDYLDMVGMDPNTKIMKINTWCHKNQWPTQALPYKLENKNK